MVQDERVAWYCLESPPRVSVPTPFTPSQINLLIKKLTIGCLLMVSAARVMPKEILEGTREGRVLRLELMSGHDDAGMNIEILYSGTC